MAEKSEVMNVIDGLALHCRPPIMSADQKTVWMRDWIADLEEFPVEAIANAARRWRQSGNTKFPTAGQLLPLIKDTVPKEREDLRPWRPATEDEYRAMSIEGKIRERRILAHEASGKAKPMFRNTTMKAGGKASGIHLTKEEMPAENSHWLAIASNHEAEIKRLRERLSEARLSDRAA